jgi:hypothetical protein
VGNKARVHLIAVKVAAYKRLLVAEKVMRWKRIKAGGHEMGEGTH